MRKVDRGMSEPVRVASRADLPPGSKKLIEVDGRAVALFNVDGSFYAIDDVCTHDGGPLAEGELSGCEIQCPRHGARFDVRTGKPLSMPAFEPVATHEVIVRDDAIFIAIRD
jgi:3-phenylpropionate/trans-cinnamate dioxygenase ferredoxin subunit